MSAFPIRFISAATLVLGFCLISAPASAQTKKELVAKLIQLHQQGIDNVAHGMAAQPANNLMQAAGQALAQLPAERRDALGKEIQAEIKRFHDELDALLKDRVNKLAAPTLAPVFEEKLNEDELKQVITWLESPVAKKYSQLMPEMEATLAQKLVADSRATVEPKIKALQATLQKKLVAAQAAASAPAASPSSSPAKPAVKK